MTSQGPHAPPCTTPVLGSPPPPCRPPSFGAFPHPPSPPPALGSPHNPLSPLQVWGVPLPCIPPQFWGLSPRFGVPPQSSPSFGALPHLLSSPSALGSPHSPPPQFWGPTPSRAHPQLWGPPMSPSSSSGPPTPSPPLPAPLSLESFHTHPRAPPPSFGVSPRSRGTYKGVYWWHKRVQGDHAAAGGAGYGGGHRTLKPLTRLQGEGMLLLLRGEVGGARTPGSLFFGGGGGRPQPH